MHEHSVDGEVRQRRDDAGTDHSCQQRSAHAHQDEESDSIHEEAGQERRSQEGKQRCVNERRVLQRPKVAGRVARLVDLHDGYLHQVHVCAGCAKQHGELVLVLIAGNLQ